MGILSQLVLVPIKPWSPSLMAITPSVKMRQFLVLPLLFALVRSAITEGSRRPSTKTPKGFVTTKGSNFELDGKPFVCDFRWLTCTTHFSRLQFQFFVGANSYVRMTHEKPCLLFLTRSLGSGFLYLPPQMTWKALSSRCGMQGWKFYEPGSIILLLKP